MSLTTYHLLFTAEVVTPLELDDHSGAALRGNLYEAVWGRFCTNKASPTCADCPLHAMCPVSALVAPLREEGMRGRDVPRPYIILPPLGDARRYEPGSELLFGITLFGSIVQLLPYIMLSIDALEAAGLGRKVADHHWQRGKFTVKRMYSYNPLNGERQALYEKGKPLVNAPSLSVTNSAVQTKAQQLATNKITLNFLTPTRIVDKERLMHNAVFRPLVQRLLERVITLEETFGKGSSYSRDECQKLLEIAEHIVCIDDATRWEDLRSYSHRLNRHTPIGGIIGRATFAGNLAPFRELLVWGELIHVGKSCVKGNGWYTINDEVNTTNYFSSD
jgi:hypothetical protein